MEEKREYKKVLTNILRTYEKYLNAFNNYDQAAFFSFQYDQDVSSEIGVKRVGDTALFYIRDSYEKPLETRDANTIAEKILKLDPRLVNPKKLASNFRKQISLSIGQYLAKKELADLETKLLTEEI